MKYGELEIKCFSDSMKYGELEIKCFSDSMKYVEFTERDTKTRTGEGSHTRPFKPKIISTPQNQNTVQCNYLKPM